MSRKFKVAIIGTGARSLAYAKPLTASGEVEIAAGADPSRENFLSMCRASGINPEKCRWYADWHELEKQEKSLDGVVVTPPNFVHCEVVLAFIRRGIPILVEKPLTTTMKDSEKILDAVREFHPQIIVGFVLRSTPFYRKVRELLDSGAAGKILSIQADELASPGVSSIILRSVWRRYQAKSGGSMMEKSSHDMDLLNWFMGSRPVAVNSFGGRLLFRANPLLPEKCGTCPVKKSCLYFRNPPFSAAAGDSGLQSTLGVEADTCIYNSDNDVFDNQVVSIRYASGAVANFTLAFNCLGEQSGRNLHIIGTRGRIWGNIDSNRLRLVRNDSGKTEEFDFSEMHVSGGHNGGDTTHAMNLIRMMKDRSFFPQQDAYSGYLSNAVCIAADLSAVESKQIHFRYGSSGYIEFA